VTLLRPRVVWLIVGWELRRRLRRFTERTAQVLATAFGGLVITLGLVGLAVASFFAGREPGRAIVHAAAETVPAVVWLLAALLVGFRVVSGAADPDNRDGYLTTVPARELFAGVAVVESTTVLLYVCLPIVVAGVAFAAGSGQPAAAVTVSVAGVVPAGVGAATGMVVGFGARNLSARSRLVARLRVVLWLLLGIGYAAVFLTGQIDSALGPLVRGLTRPPFTWLADLALWPVVATQPGRGVVGAAALVVAGTVLFSVAARLATLLWYADGVETATEHGDGETTIDPGVWGTVADTRTAWVARVAATRARRAPVKLVFVVYPVFLLAPEITRAVETGRVPASLPSVVPLIAAWAGGAGFALNPLGDQGATLPVAVTSGVSGSAFVRGVALPGAVFGSVTATVAAAGLGVAAGLTATRIALVVVAGATLGVAAPALATGVGVVFPNYDTTEVVRSREAVIPSLFGFAAYSLLLVLLGGPGLLVSIPAVSGVVGGLLGVSPVAVAVGAVAVSVVLVGTVGAASLAYAGSQVDSYTV
jgi:hypothetical protein